MRCGGGFVLILEDDPARVQAMRAVPAALLPAAELAVCDNAADAIAFLPDRGRETILISLDHDLGAARVHDGRSVDPGDGRDVAEFMSSVAAACPVVVHSSNYQMVPVMIEALRRSGWRASIVTPHSQLVLGWIEGAWRGEVESLIAGGHMGAGGARR